MGKGRERPALEGPVLTSPDALQTRSLVGLSSSARLIQFLGLDLIPSPFPCPEVGRRALTGLPGTHPHPQGVPSQVTNKDAFNPLIT